MSELPLLHNGGCQDVYVALETQRDPLSNSKLQLSYGIEGSSGKSLTRFRTTSEVLTPGQERYYEDTSNSTAKTKLIQASVICATFMVIELAAGLFSNSLALLTDASHLLSDLSSFLISLFALWVSDLPGTRRLSFGYHRAEILGALISVLLIWVLTFFLVVEACHRLVLPTEVNGKVMFITAFFGTAANLVMTYILGFHSHGLGGGQCHHNHNHHSESGNCHSHQTNHNDNALCSSHHHHHHNEFNIISETQLPIHNTLANFESIPFGTSQESIACTTREGTEKPSVTEDEEDHSSHSDVVSLSFPVCSGNSSDHTAVPQLSHNVNLKAAYIHALGDLIQNIGVLIAAALIWFNPKWSIVDPFCTFLFSILVLATTISILKEAMNVLMEGTPKEIDLAGLREDLGKIESVSEVHDLHVWSLSVGKPTLACHMVIDSEEEARRVLRVATGICQVKYGILHTTIQIDFSANKMACDTNAHSKCH